MASKEEVEKLIGTLRKDRGLTMGELSLAAGWKKATTLSEMKSKGSYDEVYEKLSEMAETTNKQDYKQYMTVQIPLPELLSRMDNHTAFLQKVIDGGLLNLLANLNDVKEMLKAAQQNRGSQGELGGDETVPV